MAESRLRRVAILTEITASVAVVVSIVYLAGEVRTNTEAIRASTNQGLLELDFQRGTWLVEDSAMRRIVRDAEAGSEVLGVDELRILDIWVTTGLAMWEQAYFSNVNGVMDARVWEAWDRELRDFVCIPTLHTVWTGTKQSFGTDFQAHADSVAYECSVQ